MTEISAVRTAAPRSSVPWYTFVDDDFNVTTKASVGFTNLIATRPYAMAEVEWNGYRSRYDVIASFLETTRDVFMASVRGDADPVIADTVLAGQPPCRGREYHLRLTERQLRPPVFFRTDEAAPGTIVEIQCPGSGWELAEQLRSLYLAFPDDFGVPSRMTSSWAEHVADSLRGLQPAEPVIHHLLNNASRPHGGRYFIQRCRELGIRYFSWDDVQWKDVNLVRAHEFYDLRYNGFFDQWMESCENGTLTFDHPPTPVYDAKVIMAWPFWDVTRHLYTDEVRALFPHTNIVSPEGFRLSNGDWVTLEEYCVIGEKARKHYFKFGGSDPTLNWGSRAVYYASSLTRGGCRQILDRIMEDRQSGRHWIVQEARTCPELALAATREGEEIEVDGYTKLSAFYGPQGLVGVLAMQERSRKVHGSPQTIISIVY